MKRSLAIIICLFLLLPTLCFEVAAEAEAFAFIDGENITRTADTAIIYRGVASTKQTQWGHNIVVDAEGVVTDIIESGVSDGEDLAVPENGYVISAAGNRVAWFRTNIKKGSKLHYDAYTQRLFLLDAAGSFDPYFTKQLTLTEKAEGYVISNPLISATPLYTYDIAIDANGTVVSRGSDLTPPEGGFTVSAATKGDTASLIMYAPIGAKCTVENGVMTLTYDKTMVRRTAELAVEHANALALSAKESFVYTDHEAINTLISECSVLINNGINYRTATSIAHRLDSELASLLVQSEIYELRAAFHTPEETDIIAVRETVRAAKAAGLNTLYLRLSNGYDSFIPLPEDNKFSQAKKFGGFDVLKAYINVCAEENIALGLCVDVYYNEYASIASPDWIMQTNGDEKGVSDKYFSPTNEEFKAYFLDYMSYVVKTYGVTEIMLDHLRYPKFSEDCDYGYDYITMQEFARSHEIPINEVEAIKTELFASPHWTKWVEYRKSSVTDMAVALSETIREIRPDARITAVSARDTVEHFYMQDCLGWLENGYIDGITLALYDDIDGRDANDELAYYDSTVKDKGEIIGAYTGKESFFFT
ncbi:MAG: family 10 glycosylhydrolase, partial [Clostridia bacterium]|nr:family 10 glycosylhydrolase [Clostridia bacterium]